MFVNFWFPSVWPTWMWVEQDHMIYNSYMRQNTRWQFFCADKDRAQIIVKRPNGYVGRYPTASPNGEYYGLTDESQFEQLLWGGRSHEIQWDYTSTTGSSVSIELYKEGAYWYTIAASTPNDGSYWWSFTPAMREMMSMPIRE